MEEPYQSIVMNNPIHNGSPQTPPGSPSLTAMNGSPSFEPIGTEPDHVTTMVMDENNPPESKVEERMPVKSAIRQKGKKHQRRSLSWSDDHGYTLCEVHYSPNLHYSGQREEDEESLPGNSCCVVC